MVFYRRLIVPLGRVDKRHTRCASLPKEGDTVICAQVLIRSKVRVSHSTVPVVGTHNLGLAIFGRLSLSRGERSVGIKVVNDYIWVTGLPRRRVGGAARTNVLKVVFWVTC